VATPPARRYRFPDEADLRMSLNESGWAVTAVARTYAGQNLLIRAQRTP
jgi:hypothetical protein